MTTKDTNIDLHTNTIETLRSQIAELERSEIELLKLFSSLSQKGDLLQALMDTIPDSIYFKNTDSQFVLVNRAWASKRNIDDPLSAAGKTDFDYFDSTFAQHTRDAEKEIMQTGVPQIGELEKLKVDGNPRWYTSSKVPVRNPEGKIVGTCGITRDITELKKIENKLEDTNLQLEIRVEQRTNALNEANNRLKQQVEQLDFLYKSAFTLSQCMCNIDIHSSILLAFKPCLPDMEGCICVCDESDQFIIRHSTGTFKDRYLNDFINTFLKEITHDQPSEPILIPNWKINPSSSKIPWPIDDQHSCCVVIPIHNEETIISYLILFTVPDFIARYPQEKSVLMTLSTIAAVCIKNSVYYEELQKSARFEGELNAARNIQKKLIPQSRILLSHVEIHGYYLPAYEIGGDYLDYFQNEEGNMVIAIGDVCGKGAPASMHMTMLRTTMRIKARNEHSAMHLVCEVNNSIKSDLNSLSFISLLCVIIDKEGKKLTYARAGHPFLIQINNSTNTVDTIQCSGIALGLLGDTIPIEPFMNEVTLSISAGDQFFIYTDGLFEAVNKNGHTYGMPRLIKILKENTFENSEHLIRTVLQDIDNFTMRTPHRDDLTMCAFTIC